MTRIFIGRQPLLDRQQNTAAYELLFRSCHTHNHAQIEHSDLASSQVIFNTFLEVGLENLVGSLPAFINLHDSFLINELPIPMGAEQTVLELTLTSAPSPKLIAAIEHYRSQGYRFAFDNYNHSDANCALLKLCSYAKISFSDPDQDQIQQSVTTAKSHGVEVVAIKVETQEQFQIAKDAGCDYFQGYYFETPQVVSGRALPANMQMITTLLAKFESPETSIEELEHLLAQDAVLSYRLLRHVNSATYALRREIESLRDAIVLIGSNTIKQWAELILLSQLPQTKPSELLVISMMRAKMCELIAEHHNMDNSTTAFTVGLFSNLDALTDIPMVDLMDAMPLKADIRLALLEHEGELGGMLKTVEAYEHLSWDELEEIEEAAYLKDIYLQSIHWADINNSILKTS